VLKPNCEGGGNNLWGEEGYRALEQVTPNERTMYILMEKIQTKPIENVLVGGSKYEKTLCDYEVSCFGVIQGKGKELTQNDTVGHLIRIKPSTEREGGIFAGKGCLCTWAR
jgi:glutathione synthase